MDCGLASLVLLSVASRERPPPASKYVGRTGEVGSNPSAPPLPLQPRPTHAVPTSADTALSGTYIGAVSQLCKDFRHRTGRIGAGRPEKLELPASACKTAGSAYEGSNPSPATRPTAPGNAPGSVACPLSTGAGASFAVKLGDRGLEGVQAGFDGAATG